MLKVKAFIPCEGELLPGTYVHTLINTTLKTNTWQMTRTKKNTVQYKTEPLHEKHIDCRWKERILSSHMGTTYLLQESRSTLLLVQWEVPTLQYGLGLPDDVTVTETRELNLIHPRFSLPNHNSVVRNTQNHTLTPAGCCRAETRWRGVRRTHCGPKPITTVVEEVFRSITWENVGS